MIIKIPMQSPDGCIYQPYFIINAKNSTQTLSTSTPRNRGQAVHKLPYFPTRKAAVDYFKKHFRNASGVVKQFAQNLIGQKSRYCLGTTDVISAEPSFKADRPTKNMKIHA